MKGGLSHMSDWRKEFWELKRGITQHFICPHGTVPESMRESLDTEPEVAVYTGIL